MFGLKVSGRAAVLIVTLIVVTMAVGCSHEKEVKQGMTGTIVDAMADTEADTVVDAEADTVVVAAADTMVDATADTANTVVDAATGTATGTTEADMEAEADAAAETGIALSTPLEGSDSLGISEPGQNFTSVAMPARWSANTKIAVRSSVLDFADDDRIIMHDYFGLFFYNLNTGEIEDSIDLKALGYDFSPDSSGRISVSSDGRVLWIWTGSTEQPYKYDCMSRKLTRMEEPDKEKLFESLVLTKDIPPEKLSVRSYHCSRESAAFSDGSYGTLHFRSERITGIFYVRGDREWEVFNENSCTEPELLRQDEFLYESFAEEGSKSASALISAYGTMIGYGEYAGICALSEGVEYSEQLQKEWNNLRLSAGAREIRTTDNQACYKFYITSSDASPDSGLVPGTNEKYVTVKKGQNGWYAEGFWKDTVPDEAWWN